MEGEGFPTGMLIELVQTAVQTGFPLLSESSRGVPSYTVGNVPVQPYWSFKRIQVWPNSAVKLSFEWECFQVHRDSSSSSLFCAISS